MRGRIMRCYGTPETFPEFVRLCQSVLAEGEADGCYGWDDGTLIITNKDGDDIGYIDPVIGE